MKNVLKLRKFKVDKKFQPLPRTEGDEFYPNGIFEFNITKMLTFIVANPDKFPVEAVEVKSLNGSSPRILKEATIQTANLSSPIILAEISPGRLNVIDGNHRLEKARRQGLLEIRAYKVSADQHMAFLTSENSYRKYIEYWNSKIEDMDDGKDL